MEAPSTIERGNSTICDLNPKMLMQVWHLIIVVLMLSSKLQRALCVVAMCLREPATKLPKGIIVHHCLKPRLVPPQLI